MFHVFFEPIFIDSHVLIITTGCHSNYDIIVSTHQHKSNETAQIMTFSIIIKFIYVAHSCQVCNCHMSNSHCPSLSLL